eukprot:CAMPEP_0201234474 /NCGR_PEP_ID=MMETSP0852-20130820/6253_1 /ASSEMBLY_ACC=CAM_ASM_000632 /TAXON_ID=183588 /ORGANISM="Pseudo-nitzschia fraudulenta, Strain WWA7" /LENGTH=95 /DNA_ID=CAMNT_0047527775 /DNA_START=278 /DNA_END=563 /DNA_ORIENTATION=-
MMLAASGFWNERNTKRVIDPTDGCAAETRSCDESCPQATVFFYTLGFVAGRARVKSDRTTETLKNKASPLEGERGGPYRGNLREELLRMADGPRP